MKVFRFRDRSIELGKKPYVMGILNITPDSFSDGGKYKSAHDAVSAAVEMENLGADFIDIGGQSTRPGCITVSQNEEWERLKDVLPAVLKKVNIPVSVDTFYPFVAERALAAGAHIINDVSGSVTSKMALVVKKYSAGWVLMHSGEENTEDICVSVHNRLENMVEKAVSLGINKENICLDPGIGFGKTIEQNRELIVNTQRVKVEGNAYLLGASRKRIIGAAIKKDVPADKRDAGTVAAHTIGILGGADIIRVHDCFSACQGAAVVDFLKP